jgi:predicted amidohydrolase
MINNIKRNNASEINTSRRYLMNKRLYIETLSVATPESSEQLANVLDNYFFPVKDESLIVLPEYFIDGEKRYDGVMINDPKVDVLVNFARQAGTHIVAGMVEKIDSKNKLISGLLIGPNGFIGKQVKQTPTPFEMNSGVNPGIDEIKPFKLEDNLGHAAIAMCFEVFTRDEQIGNLPNNIDVLVNPRGFDLDDPDYGTLSEKWLLRNRNIAMMGKMVVAGATGYNGKPGALAEIIDSEADIIDYCLEPDQTISAFIDLKSQREYQKGNIISKTVPIF